MNQDDDATVRQSDARGKTDGDVGTASESFDRRSALKKTALGAAGVGLVWASPRIEGLSLRADYAQAASAVEVVREFAVTSNNFGPLNPGGAPEIRYQYSSAGSDDVAPMDDPGFVSPVNTFRLVRYTNCASTADMVWSPTGDVGVTKTDTSYDPHPGFNMGRETNWALAPAKTPMTIRVKFTC